jgi:hypothetical protein
MGVKHLITTGLTTSSPTSPLAISSIPFLITTALRFELDRDQQRAFELIVGHMEAGDALFIAQVAEQDGQRRPEAVVP